MFAKHELAKSDLILVEVGGRIGSAWVGGSLAKRGVLTGWVRGAFFGDVRGWIIRCQGDGACHSVIPDVATSFRS